MSGASKRLGIVRGQCAPQLGEHAGRLFGERFHQLDHELGAGGLASVASRGDERLEALEGEYARVLAALKALRHA